MPARSLTAREPASILRGNTYGFEVGGPILIPKLFNGRNRAFWHQDYEGFKRRGAGTPVIANVPTPAMIATVTDPTSLALLKQYQVPTSPTGTLSESGPNTANTYEWGTRGDFVLSTRDNPLAALRGLQLVCVFQREYIHHQQFAVLWRRQCKPSPGGERSRDACVRFQYGERVPIRIRAKRSLVSDRDALCTRARHSFFQQTVR